jgi:CPA2 family monovalent cation:H+ antiporter-2
MLSVAEHYDPAIPALENEAYVASIRARAGSWEADLTSQMEAIMSEVKV